MHWISREAILFKDEWRPEHAPMGVIELLKKEKFEDNLEKYYNKLARAFG
jgi:hypothetical protein